MAANSYYAQVPLGELGDFRNGVNFGKGLKGRGIGLINVKDIFTDSPHLDFDSLDRVDLVSAKGINRYFVEEGDLFFVRSSVKRDGIGYVANSEVTRADVVHCGFVIRFRPIKQRVDFRFLTYALRSPGSRERIRNLSGGAAITNISQEALRTLLVETPPLHIQRRISDILSAYDDLIENCQRRIKILETVARSLYREWFVNFRYPGRENHLLVPSPVGEIPEGWEVKPIADSFDILGGGTPSRKVSEYWEGGTIQWFAPSDLTSAGTTFMDDSGDHITALGLAESSARLFAPRSVMVTSRATIGVVSINTSQACTNQGFIVCIPNQRVPLYFLFLWLRENVPTFLRMASGATFKEISRGVFKTIDFLQVPEHLSRRFEKSVSPMFEQVLLLQRQIKNLRRTRDLLLPRLIGGQTDLGEIEGLEDDQGFQVRLPLEDPTTVGQTIEESTHSAENVEPRDRISSIDSTERVDVLCAIRLLFSDGVDRTRDAAIRDLAHALGYGRTGSRIYEVLSTDLLTAVRRGIVISENGYYRIGIKSYGECDREWLKFAFESAIGRSWTNRDDAIRAFARWGGFARVGPVIESTARSLINGLIREGRLETDGPDLIRRT